MQGHIRQLSDDDAARSSHDRKGEQHCRNYLQAPVLRYALVRGCISR